MWCLKSSASAVRLEVKSGMQLEVGAAEDPNLAQLRKSNPQMEVCIYFLFSFTHIIIHLG